MTVSLATMLLVLLRRLGLSAGLRFVEHRALLRACARAGLLAGAVRCKAQHSCVLCAKAPLAQPFT